MEHYVFMISPLLLVLIIINYGVTDADLYHGGVTEDDAIVYTYLCLAASSSHQFWQRKMQ